MRIGLPPHHFYRIDSVMYVFRLTATVLGQHELVYFPSEYDHCSRDKQAKLVREWLEASDVIVGPIDLSILQIRNQMTAKPPYICLLLGCLSRGGRMMLEAYPLLQSSDVLVGNCTADVELAKKFFDNAQVTLLPLAFDETVFYPMSKQEREAARSKLQFKPEDNILLYSGRITIEKNLHTLLKTFAIVEQMLPNAHLLIAGTDFDVPFTEFGVFPLSVRSMLDKIVSRLKIKRAKFIGQQNVMDLRALYNIADLAVNFTLHHDENFGLAQIEAMACGTPVAATQWGGLKDTVVEGVTGASISTIVTGTGVKVDWWEAANKIVQLLNETKHNMNFRAKCALGVLEKYSQRQYQHNISAILTEVNQNRKRKAEPLVPSEFALEFWYRTSIRPGQPVPYRSGSQSYDMYRKLIGSFAGRTQNGSQNRLPGSQILCLAVPVRIENGSIAVEDPIYPFEITAPPQLAKDIHSIIDRMSRQPVIYASALVPTGSDLQEAFAWLIEMGIVLISGYGEKIAPEVVNCQMVAPLFTIQSVNASTDVIYIK